MKLRTHRQRDLFGRETFHSFGMVGAFVVEAHCADHKPRAGSRAWNVRREDKLRSPDGGYLLTLPEAIAFAKKQWDKERAPARKPLRCANTLSLF